MCLPVVVWLCGWLLLCADLLCLLMLWYCAACLGCVLAGKGVYVVGVI